MQFTPDEELIISISERVIDMAHSVQFTIDYCKVLC